MTGSKRSCLGETSVAFELLGITLNTGPGVDSPFKSNYHDTPNDQRLWKDKLMTIKERKIDNVTILVLKGDLMGEPETAKLRERINSSLQAASLNLVVDLAGVRYVSSTGLGTLIACLTSTKSKGGDLRLSRVTEKVESLFVITQLVKVFKEYETVERAVESYA